jgi:hypothetical protein
MRNPEFVVIYKLELTHSLSSVIKLEKSHLITNM